MKTLLEKYMSWKITPAEFDKLKSAVQASDDAVLGRAMEEVWDQAGPGAISGEAAARVKSSLRADLALSRSRRWRWHSVAAAIMLPMLVISTIYFYLDSRESHIEHQTFSVFAEGGQKTRMSLPDGTQVWLNSDSRIDYNTGFNIDNRDITVSGEVFFDVNRSEAASFRVTAGGVSVVVHGTAFNVSAYPEEQTITVTLNRGLVTVENEQTHATIAQLLPNQQIVIDKANLSGVVTDCDAQFESLWTQNKLKLDAVDTQSLFKAMERWYGVDIKVENIDPRYVYSLTIMTESLADMLNLINRLTPINYTINGEEVTIRYK